MSALFDVEDTRASTHACTGPACRFCEWLDGHAAKAKAQREVRIDPRWSYDAGTWRRGLPEGATFTADDLIDALGLPDGHPNQVGAVINQWHKAHLIAYSGTAPSRRASNHARRIVVWRATHGL